MAYDRLGLRTLAYNDGFTLWFYATPDSEEDVRAMGYFLPARDMLRKGDMMIALCRAKEPDEVMLVLHIRPEAAVTALTSRND